MYGTLVPSGDFFRPLPLRLEMNGLGVPFLNGGRYGIHRHNAAHEGWGYSYGEVPNKDIGVFDIGPSDVVLEFGDILIQRGRIGSILLKDHSLGCEPSNGGSGGISLLKIFIEFGNEVPIGP